MRANNVGLETRGVSERNRFGKCACGCFDLVTAFDKPAGKCFEKRDVRRVCEINPETHRESQLKFDQPATITQ
jgi:hypothetical protein